MTRRKEASQSVHLNVTSPVPTTVSVTTPAMTERKLAKPWPTVPHSEVAETLAQLERRLALLDSEDRTELLRIVSALVDLLLRNRNRRIKPNLT